MSGKLNRGCELILVRNKTEVKSFYTCPIRWQNLKEKEKPVVACFASDLRFKTGCKPERQQRDGWIDLQKCR